MKIKIEAKRKPIIKTFIIHIIIFIILSMIVMYGCVFNKLLGIVCPGCGVTRAWLCFFRLDIKSALYYHALFPFIPIYIFVFVHKDMRFMTKIKKISVAFLYFFTPILILYNIYRIYFAENIFPNGII